MNSTWKVLGLSLSLACSPLLVSCVATSNSLDEDGDGYIASSDCDDTNASAYPGAEELCNTIDDDCDGDTDESDATDQPTWYQDSDGDGYGLSTSTQVTCNAPSGYTAQSGDCDDTDGDINPGASESCDGVDNDCDGETDESGASGETLWYLDDDGDGYGVSATSLSACAQPEGYAALTEDCDDTNGAISPGATEVCNTIDDNCDGETDEAGAADEPTWYRDTDSDGYGQDSITLVDCTQPSGYVALGGDCFDQNAAVNPGVTEVCDNLDNNCDGNTDESTASDAATWYPDADKDSYGLTSGQLQACKQPSGYVSVGGDCDDTSTQASPGVTESCDGIDNDCDGSLDESGSTGEITWYYDADGDGYGLNTKTQVTCNQPDHYVSVGGDCNDTAVAINPGATEVCDSADTDENCNGSADDSDSTVDSNTFTIFYKDADYDGYGGTDETRTKCDKDYGYVINSSDCADSDADRNPGETEFCGNGKDENCVEHDSSCTLPSEFDVQDSDYYIASDYILTSNFGYVLLTPDTNNDGIRELVITGEENQNYQGDSGFFFPYSSKTWGALKSSENATAIYYDNSFSYQQGASGDYDGDGYDDLIFSASSGAYAYVVYGRTSYLTGNQSLGSAAYTKLTMPTTYRLDTGDFNDDGVDDVIMGLQKKIGVFAGSTTRYSTRNYAAGYPYLDIQGSNSNSSYFGQDAANIGDINGDGVIDIAASDPNYSSPTGKKGAVFIFYGGTYWRESGASGSSTPYANIVLYAGDSDTYFSGIFPAGDVDGDGYADFLVSGFKTVFLVYGGAELSSTLYSNSNASEFKAPSDSTASFGIKAAAGDFDGDGYSDIVVGESNYDEDPSRGSYNGAAYLYWGSSTRFDSEVASSQIGVKITGNETTGSLGSNMTVADLDDDGKSELILADMNSSSHSADGVIYIVKGRGE